MLSSRYAFFPLLLALSACGGGGGGSTLPQTPTLGSGATPQSVHISIKVPARSTPLGLTRRPAYISSQTQSATISVNGAPPVTVDLAANAPDCTPATNARICTLSVNAPLGTDVFAANLYATTDGTGAVLSRGSISAAIIAGQANIVTLTLNGVPTSVGVVLATSPRAVQGTAATIGLTVTVKDAAGAAIIGADPFTTPITVTDSDITGATSLSSTALVSSKTLNSPDDAANLSVTYSGAALATPAVFGASGSGLSSADIVSATLAAQPLPPTAFNNYTTFGFDAQHDVFNPNSSTITPASLSGLHLAMHASIPDYSTQSQPVLATNIAGHAGVLFVGGGSGSMYAYDALTGSLIWSKNYGVETFTCTPGVNYYFGIGGAAAYDVASKSLYVMGNSNAQANAVAHNTLLHLDAATGAILGSVNVSPDSAGSTSELNFSHTSVTLGTNGIAYVGTGSTCDISPWRGRVAAVSVPSMQLVSTFFTVWNGATQPWGGGGVWGYGGVSLDFAGNVLTGVGNTDNGTNNGLIVAPFQAAPREDSGYGDAFLAISRDLTTVLAANHPIASSVFGSTSVAVDLDLNGTPVIIKPTGVGCDTLAAIQGKSGTLFLYDTTHIGSGPLSQYQLSPPSYSDEFLGEPAYSPVTGLIYSPVPVGAGSLFPPGMMAVNPGCGSPTVAWHTAFGPDSDISGNMYARSVPAVSAGGVVFVGTPCAPDATGGCTGDLTTASSTRATQASRKPQALCCNPVGSPVGGALWALDAATGAVLNGGIPLFTTPAQLREPPTIDGNWVFVLDNSGNLYGLTLDSKYPTISVKYRSVDARSHLRWEAQPRVPRGD